MADSNFKPEKIISKGDADIRDKNVPDKEYHVCGENISKYLVDNRLRPAVVVTGGDTRIDSLSKLEQLNKGLELSGTRVINLGHDIPKPIVYHEAVRLNARAIAYVSASHLNEDYNGLKTEIVNRDKDLEFLGVSNHPREDAIDAYIGYLRKEFENIGYLPNRNKKPIIVDSLYGTSSGFSQRIFDEIGFNVIGLHAYPSRRFPTLHENAPDPHEADNLEDMIRMSETLRKSNNRTIGVCFDGDMDRVAIIDENGIKLSEDEVTMIIASHLIRKARSNGNFRPAVVYEIKSSNAVRETIKSAEGIPFMQKTGGPNIKNLMKRTEAIFGGELSGHNYYGEGFYPVPYADDGLYTALMIAKIVGVSNTSLADLRSQLPRYPITNEIRIEHDKEKNPDIILNFKKTFIEQYGFKNNSLDGDSRVEKYDDNLNWKSWVVLRSSNNEPEKLTIRMEGRDRSELLETIGLFYSTIKEDPVLLTKVKNAIRIDNGRI